MIKENKRPTGTVGGGWKNASCVSGLNMEDY